MKSEGPLRHFVVALLLAVGCYLVFYPSIEHRRTRKGPWEVTFTSTNEVTLSLTNAGVPLVIINQPRLAITNVQLLFVDRTLSSEQQCTNLILNEPKPVPYPVPFGECKFMDTTFLPGTVTFQLFDHTIELMPRVLVIDRREHPWVSNNLIQLYPQDSRTRAQR